VRVERLGGDHTRRPGALPCAAPKPTGSAADQQPQSSLRYRATGPVGSVFWIEDDMAFVVSGPADRARLQKIAETVYEQIETRQQTGALLHMLSAARP